jgi:MFS family permease
MALLPVMGKRSGSFLTLVFQNRALIERLRLNLMFTIAAVATNVCALPVGTILDRYGPRLCGIIGSLLMAIGTALFASGRDLPFDGFTPGYFFLALGGPFVFISSFQLSNCFPAHSGLILALLTGAFDSSSALFLVFRLIFEGTRGRVTTRELFLGYLIVPIFIFVVQMTIMPRQSYKTVGEIVKQAEDEVHAQVPDVTDDVDDAERERRRIEHRMRRESAISEINSLLETPTNSKRIKREDKKNKKSGVWGALHGYSAFEQIKTPWFWLITMFTVVQMTRINYFVATIRPQYEYLLHSVSEARTVNQIFDVLLPVGGVFSIPFIGSILDRTSTPFALACLVVTATLIGILGLIPHMWAAIANVCLFGKFILPNVLIRQHLGQPDRGCHSHLSSLLLHCGIRLFRQSLRLSDLWQSLRPHHLPGRSVQFPAITTRCAYSQSFPQQPATG